MNINNEELLLQWQAPERPHPVRGKRWYLIGGLIVIAIATYGIMRGEWSVSIVSLMTGAVYFLLRDHTPPLVDISIARNGVYYKDTFTRWEDLDGFWILETRDYSILHIHRKHSKAADIAMLTGDQDLAQIRMVLSSFVPELTPKGEGLLDAFARISKL